MATDIFFFPVSKTRHQNQMPEHCRPSAEERDMYYFGFLSEPKLVARSNSSDKPWQLRVQDQHVVTKRFYPVSHAIDQKWEDAHFMSTILAALYPLDWNSLDVVCIGYRDDCPAKQEKEVILWVGVPPDSTTWDDGDAAATRVRQVLLDAGNLDDVHCEIREAVCADASTPVQTIQSDFAQDFPTLTSTIGQSIASEAQPEVEGTVAFFLSVIKDKCDKPDKVALTCRHVLFRDDTAPYAYGAGTGDRKLYALMPGDRTLRDVQRQADNNVAIWDSHGHNPAERKRAADFATTVHKLDPHPTRRLGHVLFSPARLPVRLPASLAPSKAELNFPVDYAVLELDKSRLGDEYDTLTNVVYIGNVPKKELGLINSGVVVYNHLFRPRADGLLRLRGVIPVDEIKSPSTVLDSNNGEYVLRVGKRGRTTGLT
jgi:hypothetical protein